ncbi:MAG: hypothetical protein FWC79_05890 [Oscillospiraceae bacterium]|nr:hypothetical protein [Oscillospiraceae bacterium]
MNRDELARFDSDREDAGAPWRGDATFARRRIDLFLQGESGFINPPPGLEDLGMPNVIIDLTGNALNGRQSGRPIEPGSNIFINANVDFSDYIDSGTRFSEEFVEIMIRGEVEISEDGSEIITRPPVRKIFLIYTVISELI